MKKITFILLFVSIFLSACSEKEEVKVNDADAETVAEENTVSDNDEKQIEETENVSTDDYSAYTMEKIDHSIFTFDDYSSIYEKNYAAEGYQGEDSSQLIAASGIEPKQELIGVRYDEMSNLFYLLTRSQRVSDFLFDLNLITSDSDNPYVEVEHIRGWIEEDYSYDIFKAYSQDGGAPASRLDVSNDNGASWNTIFSATQPLDDNPAVSEKIQKFEFHKLYQVELLDKPLTIKNKTFDGEISSLQYFYDSTNGSGHYTLDLKLNSQTDSTIELSISNISSSSETIIKENLEVYKDVPFEQNFNSSENDYLYLEDKIIISLNGESIVLDLKESGFDTGNQFVVDSGGIYLSGIEAIQFDLIAEKDDFLPHSFSAAFYGYNREEEAPPLKEQSLEKNFVELQVDPAYNAVTLLGNDENFAVYREYVQVKLKEDQQVTKIINLAEVN